MSRSRWSRLGAAAGVVVFWALVSLGGEFDITLPGILDDLWYSAARVVAVVAAGLVAGFLVGRWWVLLAATTPVAVYAGLELAGHVAPWHDSGPPLADFWRYGGLWSLTWFYAVPLAIGILVRKGLAAPPATRDASFG